MRLYKEPHFFLNKKKHQNEEFFVKPFYLSAENNILIHIRIKHTMHVKITTTAYEVYESPNELEDEDYDLLLLAKKYIAKSFAPYSKLKTGAAVLLSNSKMVAASGVESHSYALCQTAEQVAITTAVTAYPDATIETIAITGAHSEMVLDLPITPCGSSRQLLCEMETRQKQAIRLILHGEDGDVIVFASARDLLPLAFNAFLVS